MAQAMADMCHDLRRRPRGEAELLAGMGHGTDEIAGTIDQGAVQIEYDELGTVA